MNLTLAQIKIIAFVVTIIVLILGSYYKGVSDTSQRYETKLLEAQLEISNKLAKVEQQSLLISDSLVKQSEESSKKLDLILRNKRGPLTSVPCTPSTDFVSTWNLINKETK